LKTQAIRLIDIFFIAPLLVFVALKYRIPEPAKTTLLVTGILTAIYNGGNYLENRA
jgi:hypothetical protein